MAGFTVNRFLDGLWSVLELALLVVGGAIVVLTWVYWLVTL